MLNQYTLLLILKVKEVISIMESILKKKLLLTKAQMAFMFIAISSLHLSTNYTL